MRDGAHAMGDILEQMPEVDAVVCITDDLARGAMRHLTNTGRRIPDDVAVIGFDDLEDSAYCIPSLSTVNPHHDVMVQETVRLLLRRIQNPDAPVENATAPFTVITRQSTQGMTAAAVPPRTFE